MPITNPLKLYIDIYNKADVNNNDGITFNNQDDIGKKYFLKRYPSPLGLLNYFYQVGDLYMIGCLQLKTCVFENHSKSKTWLWGLTIHLVTHENSFLVFHMLLVRWECLVCPMQDHLCQES